MTAYAYVRVSTDRQDLDNQRHGILEYANSQSIGAVKFVEDAESGRLSWKNRALGQLLTETAQKGDVVIFAEISRMARSTLQVLEMLECCRKSAALKLDAFETEIRTYLAKGISKRSIAKLLDCSPSTLYDWLERRGLRKRAITSV